MTTKLRTTRHRCFEKTLFLSMTQATSTALAINRKNAKKGNKRRLRGYECNACNFYHLTSDNPELHPTVAAELQRVAQSPIPRCQKRIYRAQKDAEMAALQKFQKLSPATQRVTRPRYVVKCDTCQGWHLQKGKL